MQFCENLILPCSHGNKEPLSTCSLDIAYFFSILSSISIFVTSRQFFVVTIKTQLFMRKEKTSIEVTLWREYHLFSEPQHSCNRYTSGVTVQVILQSSTAICFFQLNFNNRI